MQPTDPNLPVSPPAAGGVPVVPPQAATQTQLAQRGSTRTRRWALIRDVLVFQAKLFIDGVKDVVLGPLTLVAALVDLFAAPGSEGKNLYAALREGRRFERWLNLFEPVERAERTGELGPSNGDGIDRYFQSLESMLVDQVQKGGMTASAKDALDGALDGLRSQSMLGAKWKPPEGSVPAVPSAPNVDPQPPPPEPPPR